jgi:hypothetical protein
MTLERLAELCDRYGQLAEITAHWPAVSGDEPLVSSVTLTTKQYSYLRRDLLEMLAALKAMVKEGDA